MTTVSIILAVLAGVAAIQLVAWVVFGVRAWRESRAAPFVRDSLARPALAVWPRISVVVPAHNEERVAGACARSILASEYPDFEVVFVLDRCTVGTRRALEPLAAADARLRIIDNAHCPPDWAGKCNAARIGAGATAGELVLFTDADTLFDPHLLRASVALLRERSWQMMSLLSAPTHNHWFELIVQPVASIALLKLFPIRRANASADRRAFANGQFMLFERAAYDALGGHAAVRNDLLEDMGFARRMKALGMRQGVGVSGGMLVVSMYDSWAAFRAGWRRIYIECCVRNPARLRRQAVQFAVLGPGLACASLAAVALGCVVQVGAVDAGPAGGALAGAAIGMAAGAWVVSKLVLLAVYRACAFPLWSVLLFSVACSAVAAIFLHGARDLAHRTPVRWGGRDYVLEPTDH